MENEKMLIDDNALCDCFEKAAHKCEYIEDMVFHLDYILDEITGADEVDAVEVVHGKWEQLGEADYKCSACGFRFTSADPISMFEYCRCGAKMDGGNKDG